MSLVQERATELINSARDLLTLRSVATLLWPILLFWIAQSNLHLLIWLEDPAVIYPSESTEDRTLPLTYLGGSARSVTLLKVHIVNDGTSLIGGQEELWSLQLKATNASHAAIVGDLHVKPEGTVVQFADSPDPGTVTLLLGALEPKAEVRLQLMLVNTIPPQQPKLEADVSLVGLPREVTWLSPEERVGNSLFLPVAAGILIIFIFIRGLEIRNQGLLKEKKNPVVFLIGQLLFFAFAAMIFGYIATRALALIIFRLI